MSEHPLPRYRSEHVLQQHWVAQPNDIAKPTIAAMSLGGSWCITLADEIIGDRPMRPGEGTHIICDFVDEQVAKAIVAQHNQSLDHEGGAS